MGIEQLFEETQQVYDIDKLIQAVAADKRELSGSAISKNEIVKEAISPGRADVREGDDWSMGDQIHLTPRSRPKEGLQPIVRRPSAMPVAWHAAMALLTKLFGRKVLAGR
ncbi:hypothetical protein GCM10010520_67030 [Rhizobium viscosum]|uniref:Uncharacterized protein n=1 Tax=Rhizobium viscosum TaxID=1673 RepID=A0ABR9IU50_RHIVS|nr:hypothetical protein [Rhizobium viscosum]MBE1506635.1 hypothetical protein [Rhizobium viscosum]